MALNDCYVMRGHLIGNTTKDGYIHWTSLNTPDYAGIYSGYGPSSLEDIIIDYRTKVPVVQNNAGASAVLSFPETTTPPSPSPNAGLIYYDATTKRFYISENGGSFVPLLTGTNSSTNSETGNYSYVPGTISVGDVVYVKQDNIVDRACAINDSRVPVVGFVINLITTPNPIATVQYSGELTLSRILPSLLVGSQYYLSKDHPGQIMNDLSQLSGGNVLQKVGYAKDTDTFIIDIDVDYIIL